MDALAHDYDRRWGEIEPTHGTFVERFLSMLPPDGGVLDAACGTGKYFPMVSASGRSVLGVDQSSAVLAIAESKFSGVPTKKLSPQDLPHEGEFDGVMCVDAMESIPPEDWPAILGRFHRALRPGGWLYLTVELAPEDEVRPATERARRLGHPVVEGEWAGEFLEPDDYYHYYPPMQRVRAWLAAAGFAIQEEADGPWHEEGYAYHHVLARMEPTG